MRSVVAAVVGLSLAVSACGSEPEASRTRSSEPVLGTSRARLAAALHCQPGVTEARAAPVLLVTGGGTDGSVVWPPVTQPALAAARHPSCYLEFPQHTTGDVQIAAEYVAHAIRALAERSGRRIAIYASPRAGRCRGWR